MSIHLNNAGAGLMPPAVLDALTGYLREEADGGAYEAELRHQRTLEREVYEELARLLDAQVDDIGLFDSATRAWSAVVGNLSFGPADRVWITPYEYAGNLILWTELRRRYGFHLDVVPLLQNGDPDLDWMSAHINDDVAVISVPHVPSGCGIALPVEEIGEIVAPWRCLYVVDACQSVGQLPVSVASIGCDLLTGAGRKFLRGPRGTGFAAIGTRLREMVSLPFHDLHVADMVTGDEYEVRTRSARRFEYAERNNAAVVGLHVALTHHFARTDPGPAPLREAVHEVIAELPGSRLIDPGSRHAAIVTFDHDRVPAAAIRAGLQGHQVNVWIAEGSHTPLYMRSAGVDQAVRVSPHYYNDMSEVEAFAKAMRDVLR